eukprot:gene22205-26956_t
MERLGANRLEQYTRGDDQTSLEQIFYKWNSRIVKHVQDAYGAIANEYPSSEKAKKVNKKDTGKQGTSGDAGACCGGSSKKEGDDNAGGGCCSSNKKSDEKTGAATNRFEDADDDDELDEEDQLNNAFVTADEGLVDMEEMGNAMHAAQKEKLAQLRDSAPREMVTKLQYKALTKEGYKIIGSHSAVKICRWTKHQLRGRGGCCKHSFY